MPRIRTIKPELPADRRLASASIQARYTFVLLFTQADDDGLVPGDLRQLLGSLYPHNHEIGPDELREWLRELTHIGRIRWRSTRDGAPVIEIVNWSKHQLIRNPSKPFLRNQLTGLAGSPTEGGQNSSTDPTEQITNPTAPLTPKGGADLGPRTVGPRTVEEEEVTSAAASSAAGRKVVTDALADHPTYRSAFEGAMRASRNPAALLAELTALHDGMPGHGGPHPWDVIGQALHELAVGGDQVTVPRLRGFCDVVAKGRIEAVEGKPERPPRNFAEAAEREEAKARAAL